MGVGVGDDQCRATVGVRSKCEQVEVGGKPKQEPKKEQQPIPGLPLDFTDVAIARELAPLVLMCLVTYEISVGGKGNMSVVEFTVDGESFQVPKPIEPGKSDFVQISHKKPADCERKKVGVVKLDCKGKTTVIDKLEVCVLS